MHYVYTLLSEKDGYFYTGSTNDLKRRIEKHNTGRVNSTKNRRPLKLIYFEACLNESDARQRERYLKSGMGKKYLRNRLKNSLQNL
jgi:putative endonuclease